jgi:hypothetical protein
MRWSSALPGSTSGRRTPRPARRRSLRRHARRDDLPDLVALRATHAEALQRLSSEEGQAGAQVADWLKGAESVVDRLRRGEYEGLSGVEAPPAELEAWIAGRRADAAAHAELERPEDQQEIRAALAELDGRQALGERSDAVLARLDGLKKVAAIEAAKAKTKTGEVSLKITKFTGALVESDLQAALEVQLAALDFRGFAVEPKARTKAGAPMMGPSSRRSTALPSRPCSARGSSAASPWRRSWPRWRFCRAAAPSSR